MFPTFTHTFTYKALPLKRQYSKNNFKIQKFHRLGWYHVFYNEHLIGTFRNEFTEFGSGLISLWSTSFKMELGAFEDMAIGGTVIFRLLDTDRVKLHIIDVFPETFQKFVFAKSVLVEKQNKNVFPIAQRVLARTFINV